MFKSIFSMFRPSGLMETGFHLAEQLAIAAGEISGLAPGESVQVPDARVGLNGIHYNIHMTVQRDGAAVQQHDPLAVNLAPVENQNPGYPTAAPAQQLTPEMVSWLQKNIPHA